MVFEGDLLPADPSIVVVPLLLNYPAVRYLNPDIVHDGARYVLATRFITAVNRTKLRWTGNVSGQGYQITRAINVLMSGV